MEINNYTEIVLYTSTLLRSYLGIDVSNVANRMFIAHITDFLYCYNRTLTNKDRVDLEVYSSTYISNGLEGLGKIIASDSSPSLHSGQTTAI